MVSLRDLATHAPTAPTRSVAKLAAGDRTSAPAQLLGAATPDRSGPTRSMAPLVAAALFAVATIGGLVWLARSPAPIETAADGAAGDEAPEGFGTWADIAPAPIETRAHAAVGWAGDEVLVWAGASLSRGTAYADGAAYDPGAGTWRDLPTPGWGHPGLVATMLDGQFYATAKGGSVRLDPATGEVTDLAAPDDLLLAALVAVDGRLYGIGPRGWEADAAREIAIAAYDPTTDTWGEAIVHHMAAEPTGTDGLFSHLIQQPVRWTGREIIVWFPDGTGLAHDPASGTWRELPLLTRPGGTIPDPAMAAVAGGQLIALAADPADAGEARMARLDDDRWRWRDDRLPIAIKASTTVAEAGDWLAVFSPDDPPVVIHGPSGAWQVVEDGPLVEAPNTVWTGDRLLVWGGYGPGGDTGRPASTVWTPPVG